MIDIALIIRIIVTVGQVLKDMWEGPLGDIIRDLLNNKSKPQEN